MKRISAPTESLIEKRNPGDTLLEVEYLIDGRIGLLQQRRPRVDSSGALQGAAIVRIPQ
jgi:hypothetical protein